MISNILHLIAGKPKDTAIKQLLRNGFDIAQAHAMVYPFLTSEGIVRTDAAGVYNLLKSIRGSDENQA